MLSRRCFPAGKSVINRCEPINAEMQNCFDFDQTPVLMSALNEDKLVSFLAEIQSDIRQIKSDLQALIMLLKQQENATIPASFADGDDMAEPAASGQSASPEDVLRYLRETRGEDGMGE